VRALIYSVPKLCSKNSDMCSQNGKIVQLTVNKYTVIWSELLCRRVAFVRPSVRLSVFPSVAYIANNSKTQRPSVPIFGRKVPRLRCELHTSFRVKRSKVRVTINADTHRAPYLLNGKAYELQT